MKCHQILQLIIQISNSNFYLKILKSRVEMPDARECIICLPLNQPSVKNAQNIH